MGSPGVSVLMSVYNGQRFLREAIDSILAQTEGNFEFIIINDGSSDATAEILSSYEDPRLRIVHQENCGMAVSLNRGLKMARAKLVARMDADDIALADRLAVQLKEYERWGQVDVLGGQVEFISETGYSLGTIRYPLSHKDIVDRLETRPGTAILHPTVLYKRESVLGHGGYDPFFSKSSQDYDLWLRMSRDCRFANTKETVLKLRLNSNSVQSNGSRMKGHSRSSVGWYISVARQRHLLEKAGAGHLWKDSKIREQILELLWPRVLKSGLDRSILANRMLALVRADLNTPGLRLRGIGRGVRLCCGHPISTLRYLIRRKYPDQAFLKAQEIMEYARVCAIKKESKEDGSRK